MGPPSPLLICLLLLQWMRLVARARDLESLYHIVRVTTWA